MDLEKITTALAISCLSAMTCTNALAIGDSAGCTAFMHVNYFKPAVMGTVKELQESIEATIDEREHYIPSRFDRILFRISSAKQLKWRDDERKKILFGPVGCTDASDQLIRYVVAAGNLEVVTFLLDAGVSPNVRLDDGNTLFMECELPPGLSAEFKYDAKKRISALAILLDRGGKLDEINSAGRTALQECRDLEILAFYVSKGANLRKEIYSPNRDGHDTALSLAVLDGITYDFMRKTETRPIQYNGLERARFFAEFAGNSIAGTAAEYYIRLHCGDRMHREACEEFAKFIRASPGTFEGEPTKLGR